MKMEREWNESNYLEFLPAADYPYHLHFDQPPRIVRDAALTATERRGLVDTRTWWPESYLLPFTRIGGEGVPQ